MMFDGLLFNESVIIFSFYAPEFVCRRSSYLARPSRDQSPLLRCDSDQFQIRYQIKYFIYLLLHVYHWLLLHVLQRIIPYLAIIFLT